jgi:Skp family chaperone for outer membrane proteins
MNPNQVCKQVPAVLMGRLDFERRPFMKRVALAIAATLLMAPQALAYSVGYIDSARLFRESATIKQAQAEIQSEQDKIQKAFEDRQKKLEEARKTQKEEEVQKLQAQYSQELSEMRDHAQQVDASLSKKIKDKVEGTIQVVAKKRKIDVVIDKQAVYYGGIDLTNDVLGGLK